MPYPTDDRVLRSTVGEEESQGSSSFDFRTATGAGIDRYAQLYEQTMNFRNMWSGGDFDRYRFNYERVTLRPSSAWREQTREERTTMNIAIKLPELTEQEKSKLLTFYKKVLQDGYAQWPLRDGQAALWIDGKVRRIQSYSEWLLASEILYIGHSSDRGERDVSDPTTRLAIVTALMTLTGHACDQTLMELVERRLATIMAGNFQTAVAPLGQRADGRPIEQMAWSTGDGLAARLEGEWVRPLTGEPVEIGAGWVVLDLPKQEAVPFAEEVPPSVSQVMSDGRTLREFVEDRDYATRWLDDGRLAIPFGTESHANNVYQAAINFGCQNLVVEFIGGRWCVTTAPRFEIPLPAIDEDNLF